MKVKKFAFSFLFTLSLFVLLFFLFQSGIIAECLNSPETVFERLNTFFGDFISYKQTGVNIAMLRVGGLTLKLDLELIRNILNKATDIFMITVQNAPKFIFNFICDFAIAVTDVVVSFYNAFSALVQ